MLMLGITILMISLNTSANSETLLKDSIGDNNFTQRFLPHDPMYFSFGVGKPPYSEENLLFIKYQISFRYQMFDFFYNRIKKTRLSFNLAYTQLSFWDIESRSHPFYDNNYMPSVFVLYDNIGGLNWNWIDRLDFETGYKHHSNGRDGFESRSIDQLYIQPKFIWQVSRMSHITFAPEFRYYFSKSRLNSDIENYWGYSTLELIWSSNIGIQLHTWFVPAKIESSFQAQLTFSMNKIWKPLNFYLFTAYHSGFGETIIDYDKYSKGYLLGIALIR